MSRIERIEHILIKAPEYPDGGWVVTRVCTADGAEGLGECFVPDRFGDSAHAALLLSERMSNDIVGRSVLKRIPIWESLYDLCRRLYDRRGTAIHVLSGIDMAVHDAAARTLGIPLCELLGGRVRDRVRVYVSSIWVDPHNPESALDATARYVSEGYTAIKYYGWESFGEGRDDAKLLRKIRVAAGDGTELMLDLGRPTTLDRALRMARLIADSEIDLRWWEEPLSTSDQAGDLARLTAAGIVPIAGGEGELTSFAFRDLIERRTVDILQPDLSWVGGLTEGVRIAELARQHGMLCVPHNWGTAINTAASVHLVAAMPAGELCEYPITPRRWGAGGDGEADPSPMMTEIVRQPVTVQDGYAVVPKAPGLGVELDAKVVERYRV
ncbi:MAG: mandelate racemase/muconate lactonizing enzyme family protein [Candidatus Latescibacterota bacterium]|nr:mandelate racemase/muconate lactonizing enzyme family protein [Candidatus Latescibacterota bacterium]